MSLASSNKPQKGRGTGLNPGPRYQHHHHEPIDDGWWQEEQPAPDTQVLPDPARTVITYNHSPDVPFDRSINPYRGCEHGCIYCFARPSHAYLDLSPGLDFETRLFAKMQAADCLEAELRHPRYRCAPVVLGANTDCYQPIEKSYRITRQLLERLAEFRHPVSILSKSSLILRDRDVLQDLARDNLVHVMISVTTLDADLKRRLEPRTPSGDRRLATVAALQQAGIPCGVLLAPVIPHLNDTEIETIVARAQSAGADCIASVLLRLPHELGNLFGDWLDHHYPDRARRVMNTLRAMRGGRDNDSRFGRRMTGEGPYAQLISRRMALARRRHRLPERRAEALNTKAFRPPKRTGDQLDLL